MSRVPGPRAWVSLVSGMCAIGLGSAAVAWARTDADSTEVLPAQVNVVADDPSSGPPRDQVRREARSRWHSPATFTSSCS